MEYVSVYNPGPMASPGTESEEKDIFGEKMRLRGCPPPKHRGLGTEDKNTETPAFRAVDTANRAYSEGFDADTEFVFCIQDTEQLHTKSVQARASSEQRPPFARHMSSIRVPRPPPFGTMATRIKSMHMTRRTSRTHALARTLHVYGDSQLSSRQYVCALASTTPLACDHGMFDPFALLLTRHLKHVLGTPTHALKHVQ